MNILFSRFIHGKHFYFNFYVYSGVGKNVVCYLNVQYGINIYCFTTKMQQILYATYIRTHTERDSMQQ